MSIAVLIEHFHREAETCAQALPAGADEARRAVAEALFSVAIGHKLAADGPRDLVELLRLLLTKIEPMASTDATIDLLQSDPSLLKEFLH